MSTIVGVIISCMTTQSHPLVHLGLALLACHHSATAQVDINEFNATGSDGYLDSDNESSDWIELANQSDSPQSLGGHYLSDDPTNLTKWALPETELASWAVIPHRLKNEFSAT